jgi:threonine/homoserine/homoserine lactone efflux protein
MDLALVAAFAAAVLLLSLAPGPDMLFIVANAVGGGRRVGLVAALGMSTGLAVHTVAAAFGLGALLRVFPGVLDVVRVLGALFLAYLAVSAWRRARARTPATGTPGSTRGRASGRRVYVMALLTNLANPKVVLFYLAFLPQFLTTGHGSWAPTLQMLLLGAMFIVIGLTVDGAAGLLAGSLSDRVLHNPAVGGWLERASATIFGGLAVRLVLDSG